MNTTKLHTIAPTLSKISRKSGFLIPDTYLETVENDVLTKVKTSSFNATLNEQKFETPKEYFNNLEDIVLTKLKAEAIQEENSNNIPSDYFDSLEDTVISKLTATKKVYTLKNITKYVAPIAIAASLLFIFILNTNQETVSFDSLAIAEIEALIDQGIVDADTDLLATAFSDIELATNDENSIFTNNEAFDYLSDEDLELLMYEN
ncbi:hypothetical protein ACFQ5N_01185 [Lutibacter holmesii]|uniref:Uncharacterized protein n=1 Tax=Lutibacter holmesii TaxID=1137985 RepID=A0ABW3WL92_9FLAO